MSGVSVVGCGCTFLAWDSDRRAHGVSEGFVRGCCKASSEGCLFCLDFLILTLTASETSSGVRICGV